MISTGRKWSHFMIFWMINYFSVVNQYWNDFSKMSSYTQCLNQKNKKRIRFFEVNKMSVPWNYLTSPGHNRVENWGEGD